MPPPSSSTRLLTILYPQSLSTSACSNLYFAQGSHCNLHAGADTHVLSQTSIYDFYDTSCFVCPSSCSATSPAPSGAVCGVQAVSNGGTLLAAYTSGVYVQSLALCADIWYVLSGKTASFAHKGLTNCSCSMPPQPVNGELLEHILYPGD